MFVVELVVPAVALAVPCRFDPDRGFQDLALEVSMALRKQINLDVTFTDVKLRALLPASSKSAPRVCFFWMRHGFHGRLDTQHVNHLLSDGAVCFFCCAVGFCAVALTE